MAQVLRRTIDMTCITQWSARSGEISRWCCCGQRWTVKVNRWWKSIPYGLDWGIHDNLQYRTAFRNKSFTGSVTLGMVTLPDLLANFVFFIFRFFIACCFRSFIFLLCNSSSCEFVSHKPSHRFCYWSCTLARTYATITNGLPLLLGGPSKSLDLFFACRADCG